MLKEIRPAVASFLVLSLVTGIVYPLAVTGIAQGVMPAQANGSLIEKDGKVVGSALIGQSFSDPKYFWGRPSATGPTPLQRGRIERLQPGADQPCPDRRGEGAGASLARRRSGQHRTGAGGPRHRIRQRPRSAHQPGCGGIPDSSGGAGAGAPSQGAEAADQAIHGRPPVRHPGRAAGEHSETQSGA